MPVIHRETTRKVTKSDRTTGEPLAGSSPRPPQQRAATSSRQKE